MRTPNLAEYLATKLSRLTKIENYIILYKS